MRRFEEAEKQRINSALREHEAKSQRKVQALKEKHAAEVGVEILARENAHSRS